MASGMADTFSVSNLEGPLYYVTPDDTPLLSILGGLYGGAGSNSTIFRWQTSDLRAAAQTGALEGAAFPTAQHRTRTNVFNVMQIIQEGVETSDTKRGAFGQIADVGSNHPNTVATSQGNPITSEEDFQTNQSLKQVARDMEYTIINGAFVDPSTDSVERQTRGLLAAVTTNSVSAAGAALPTVTGSSSDDVIASAAHGLDNGDRVQFSAITGGSPLVVNTTYYVVNKATSTFQIAATAGGTPLTFADISAATVHVAADVAADDILGLLQTVWDAGGIQEQETAAIVVNSWNKRKLSEVFLSNAAGTGFRQDSRTLAGVNLDTITTDFGTLNVILDRHMPQSSILVVSLDQCRLMWLDRPDLPRLAVEKLARQGLSQRIQISGEWGLMYGNQLAHGELLNTSTR